MTWCALLAPLHVLIYTYLLLGESHELGRTELLASTSDLLIMFGKHISVDTEEECCAGNVLSVGTVSVVNQTT